MKAKYLSRLLLVLMLCGCASSPARTNYNPWKMESFERQFETISGTFYVSTIPLFYAEQKDIREARHAQMISMLETALKKRSYKIAPIFEADYELQYDYSTFPDFSGSGYRHSLTIKVLPGITKPQGNPLWTATVTQPKWQDSNITPVLPSLVYAAMEKFPVANDAPRQSKSAPVSLR